MSAAISRRELGGLPGRSADGRAYVYAIEFSDGTVKIGTTDSPALRAQSLHDFAGQHGIGMVGVYLREVPAGLWKHDVEREALRHAEAQPACGREWFSTLKMADAMRAVDAACALALAA